MLVDEEEIPRWKSNTFFSVSRSLYSVEMLLYWLTVMRSRRIDFALFTSFPTITKYYAIDYLVTTVYFLVNLC